MELGVLLMVKLCRFQPLFIANFKIELMLLFISRCNQNENVPALIAYIACILIAPAPLPFLELGNVERLGYSSLVSLCQSLDRGLFSVK